MWRAVAFAMDDANAAFALVQTGMQEAGNQMACLFTVQAVQIDFILNHPATTAQVAQGGLGQAVAQVDGFITAFEAVLQGDGGVQTFVQDGAMIGEGLLCCRGWMWFAKNDAIAVWQGIDAGHGEMEGALFRVAGQASRGIIVAPGSWQVVLSRFLGGFFANFCA